MSIVTRIRLVIRQSKLPACLAEVQLVHQNTLWHLCHRLVKLTDKWMKSVSMGSFQYKNQVIGESFAYLWVILLYFSLGSRLDSSSVRLFWKLIRWRIWQLSHSCQTGIWEYFLSSLALKKWHMKMECWFQAKMIYYVATMGLIFQCDFSNWQFSNTWLLIMWLNRIRC